MAIPAQNRNLNELHQFMRSRLEQYRTTVEAYYRKQGKNVKFLFYEVGRTQARQAWLFASGRTRRGAILTYTMDSGHRYYACVDWVPIVDGRPDFSGKMHAEIYRLFPPTKYLLEVLPWEQVHLQPVGMNGPKQTTNAAVWAKGKGIKIDTPSKSVWPLPKAANPKPPAAAKKK